MDQGPRTKDPVTRTKDQRPGHKATQSPTASLSVGPLFLPGQVGQAKIRSFVWTGCRNEWSALGFVELK